MTDLINSLHKFRYKTLVEIIWLDIVTKAGWEPLNLLEQPPYKCKSYGFIVEITKTKRKANFVVLAGTVSIDKDTDEIDGWNQLITIPTGCIESIRKL